MKLHGKRVNRAKCALSADLQVTIRTYDRHLEMLAGDFDWDTVQMPLNPFDYHRVLHSAFLPVLVKRSIGSVP